MNRIDLLATDRPDEWTRILETCAPYDFYHLAEYHALAEEVGEGTARLFTYTEGDYVLALPLLLRPLGDDLAGSLPGSGWQDATSVYGYPGPVHSHQEVPDTVIRNFQSALARQLQELRVVSVFSRLHPLFVQRPLLTGLGNFAVSQTVAIDLTLSAVAQRSLFRRDHRRQINRLRRSDVTCVQDAERAYLGEFRSIYYETMRRVGAAERYFFPATYFDRLAQALGSRLRHFVCFQDNRAICAGLFVVCQGILQYHLGGTRDAALALAPLKLLLDEVRLWATDQGLRVFHLGGGATRQPDDSLLFFKKGFSDRTHEFAAWRWIVFPDVYQQLLADKLRRDEGQSAAGAAPDFFPAYRCPPIPLGNRPLDGPVPNRPPLFEEDGCETS